MSSNGRLKKLVFIVVIVAIAIPLRYGSTNRKYLLMRVLHAALTLKNCLVVDQDRPTLSPAYRAFEELLKMNTLKPIDPLADPLTTIQQTRASFSFADMIPKPSQCEVTKELFRHDGHTVDAYWVDQRRERVKNKSKKILLYFHGGGYTWGDIHGYGGIECHFSELFDMRVLHVEYRLIPEHPSPAAVQDAVAVYRALLEQGIARSDIFIMGDSAGGGLSLLTVQHTISRKLPVPAGVIVLSPWADLSVSSESYTRNLLKDVMITTDSTKWVAKVIVDGHGSGLLANDPVFSPLFGSFNGFPPMYVNVGTAEILEDDSRAIVKKAQKAGVSVTFEEGLHMMHVYPLFFLYHPEADRTLNNISKWIQSI